MTGSESTEASVAKASLRAAARKGIVLLPFASLVVVAVTLQYLEKWFAAPLASPTLAQGSMTDAAKAGTEMYIDIAKALLGYAVAAVGGLGYLVQKDVESARVPSRGQWALTALVLLALLCSAFFGLTAIQFVADSLAREMAFATPDTAGLALERRFRMLLQVQFYSFVVALALFATEVLRRLGAHTSRSPGDA